MPAGPHQAVMTCQITYRLGLFGVLLQVNATIESPAIK
jgi:hypothetical protein